MKITNFDRAFALVRSYNHAREASMSLAYAEVGLREAGFHEQADEAQRLLKSMSLTTTLHLLLDKLEITT